MRPRRRRPFQSVAGPWNGLLVGHSTEKKLRQGRALIFDNQAAAIKAFEYANRAMDGREEADKTAREMPVAGMI